MLPVWNRVPGQKGKRLFSKRLVRPCTSVLRPLWTYLGNQICCIYSPWWMSVLDGGIEVARCYSSHNFVSCSGLRVFQSTVWNCPAVPMGRRDEAKQQCVWKKYKWAAEQVVNAEGPQTNRRHVSSPSPYFLSSVVLNSKLVAELSWKPNFSRCHSDSLTEQLLDEK